jgi:hypothetical protein
MNRVHALRLVQGGHSDIGEFSSLWRPKIPEAGTVDRLIHDYAESLKKKKRKRQKKAVQS